MTPSRYTPAGVRRRRSPAQLPPPSLPPLDELPNPTYSDPSDNDSYQHHADARAPHHTGYAEQSGSTFRPPVPPFPDANRRPLTAPEAYAARSASQQQGAERRGVGSRGHAFALSSISSQHPSQATSWRTVGGVGYGDEYDHPADVGPEYTSARLDHPLSVHPPSTLPEHHPLTLPHHLPSTTSARRHSFPRHEHHPPLPSLVAQHPSTASTPARVHPSLLYSVPPQPADHTTARLPGYQADYRRATVDNTRRPVLSLQPSVSSSAISNDQLIRMLPPPTEAFLTLRLRREPRGGWPPVQREEGADWLTSLEILQEPGIGLGLGSAEISNITPTLDPPLVVRIRFARRDGLQIADDHPIVEKRLAYMTLHLSLLSTASDQQVEQIIYASDSDSSGTASSPGDISRESYSSGSEGESLRSQGSQFALVSSTFGIAKMAVLGGELGWYFVFHDLRVRPIGLFRIGAKLIDILGPGPSGISTGIIPITSTVVTRPITIFGEYQYPGAGPQTELTRMLTEQGLIGRRRRGSKESSSEVGSD